ncbi:MAG TPA: hypothetical protein VN802_17440 [Stellaceae bacterium]|nr:hypothetical protein [Stellaceae bacterium]
MIGLLKLLVVCGTVLGVFYWVHVVLLAYAGTSTFANVAISFVTDFKLDRVLAYGFGAGGVGYGLRQRKLRRKNIERLAPRAAMLEKIIDPNRTSSGLTPQGTTQPGDR